MEQRKYRFRILNASNERFYRMQLDSGLPFVQIGSDGGFLQVPVKLSEITIAPAERIDMIIDFSKQPVGTSMVLTNTARVPFDFGTPPNPETTGKIMQFRVVPCQRLGQKYYPKIFNLIKKIREYRADVIRDITLGVVRDEYNRLEFLLNKKKFMDEITEKPYLNDIEIWRIINAALPYTQCMSI